MQSYIVRFEIPITYVDFFSETLAEMANTVRTHEKYEDSPIWFCDLHYNEKPDVNSLSNIINQLTNSIGVPLPKLELIEQENKNWVAELSKNFMPIEAGRFYIFSEFSEPSGRLIDLRINPGMAFGTGQHETTYLCLEALNWLKDEGFEFKTMLDLGAGSGILAIAAAKIWDMQILATDIDPIATITCLENAEINNVKMTCKTSIGFEHITGQFDLITANILMNPLLEMAEDISAAATNYVVLSGFKTDQTEEILVKYNALGFKTAKLLVKNHWVSAVLNK
jgi:ribosomal protein L11 methyltransferase